MKIVAYGESMGRGGYVRYCQGVFGSGAAPPDVQTYFVCSESLAQVNASSLDCTRGDDLAQDLMERRLVACTATNAHDAAHRVPCGIWNEWGTSPLKEGQ